MEDSRKGKRSGKKWLSTPDPHVDGENGKEAMVYNTKREKKEGDEEKEREKEKEKKVKTWVLSSHSIRTCPRILFVQIYAYNSFLLTL